MFKLFLTKHFKERYSVISKKDVKLKKRIQKTLELIQSNPNYPSLRTHIVN